jgi:hypothetical protein
VILGGSLTSLVSLYFPWLNAAECVFRSSCITVNAPIVSTFGWGGFGQMAAVLALALAVGASAAAVDRDLATRLPLGWIAIALGIFALLSVAELWTSGITGAVGPVRIGLAPGAYVGLVGAGIAGAGAVAARWGEIMRPRRATAAAGTVITLALVASFALPALNASAYSAYAFGSLAAYTCVFACLGLIAWAEPRPGLRLATAVAIGTLVAAQLLPFRHSYGRWPYELWLLLACAAGLLVLGLVGSSGLRIERSSISKLAIVTGSVVLLVSLFLPWQSFCEAGTCSSQRGWSTSAALAGVFALGLLLVLVWEGRIVRECAIGGAIFVLTAGLAAAIPHAIEYSGRPGAHAHGLINLDYGALLGFAGAAVLVIFGVARVRPIPDKHVPVRLVPVLAALGLLAFAVAPNLLTVGDLLSNTNLFSIQSPFLTLGLLGAVASLLTLRLVLRWFDRPGDHADVVLLPLALLALAALAVIHDAIVTTTDTSLLPIYGKGISWEGWVAVFLCLLLVACGWIARRGAYPAARTDGSASTTSLATSP